MLHSLVRKNICSNHPLSSVSRYCGRYTESGRKNLLAIDFAESDRSTSTANAVGVGRFVLWVNSYLFCFDFES